MINVLYCGNDKVFDGMLTSVLSILKRTTTKEPFTFYVYTMDITRLKPEYTEISDKQIEFFNIVVKKYNNDNKVIKIDVTNYYDKEFKNTINEKTKYSPYSFLRLLLDKMPIDIERILYLDADIMFNRDITLLYNKDLTNYEYGASRDHYGKFLIHPNYINSGVMLFNLTKCRETKLFEKARKIFISKKLLFPDQSAIYKSTTKKLMLPQKFNDQKFLHKHTVVRHFSKRLFWLPYPHTDNIKQWDIVKVHKVFKYHQFDDILCEYLTLKNSYKNSLKNNV